MPIWLITGSTSGFGFELAKNALARGWDIAGTGRSLEKLAPLVELGGDRFLPIVLDMTKPEQIPAAVAAFEKRFSGLDVLVNNAGYGYQASAEESPDAEIREQFQTNVFSVFALTQALLPIMRRQKSGHIVNVTSVAGLISFPSASVYSGSKHAVEGWSLGLATEVAPLGINVTCVEPGPFRTDRAGRSLRQTPNTIADYAATAGARLQGVRDSDGNQAGDPARAAEAIIKITEVENPPRHLVLGKIAMNLVRTQLSATLAEVDEWTELSLGTDFPAA
jgi:NAD(P)-dependent dehydrogenase (short-subunit alcohol dehydrogenase family)